jgi:hypothetical protein
MGTGDAVGFHVSTDVTGMLEKYNTCHVEVQGVTQCSDCLQRLHPGLQQSRSTELLNVAA